MLLASIRSRRHPRLPRAAAVALLLAFASLCARGARASAPWTADAPGTDELWSNGLGVPQFDGAVTAAARYRGGLVVGGEFRVAGGAAARYIARWDGAHWLPLGAGLPAAPVSVAVSGDTVWAAWNERSSAPSYWTGMFARWDGAEWSSSSRSTGIANIQSMVIYHGQPVFLVLGNSGFEIQAWDGVAWSPLGPPGSLDSAYGAALFTDGDSLYFGGQFRSESTTSSTPILKVWDGSNWSVRASATGGANSGYVLCEGSSGGQLIIGGKFSEVNGVPVTNIATRAGNVWRAMGSELGPEVTQITDDGAGHPLAFGAFAGSPMWGQWPGSAIWDGAHWQLTPNDLYPSARGVVANSGQLFAFGSFQQSGFRELHGFAKLDGSEAQSLGSAGAPAGGLGGSEGGGAVNAIASFGGTTLVGGSIGAPGDTLCYDCGRGVMELDGNGWRSLTEGTYFGGRVLALHTYGDRLLAGGRFNMSLDFRYANSLAQWDGTYWWPMGEIAGEVDAFAEYHGSLYIGGKFGTADGLLCSSMAKWNGTRWLPVGPVVLDTAAPPQILAMTVWHDRLVVAGSFENRGGTLAHNIAAWDGSSWSALPGSPQDPATALAPTDSVLYVGVGTGLMDPLAAVAGDQPLYTWDGSQWRALPAPPNTGVRSMLATASGLYVGADFGGPDGDLIGLARFDGSNWYAMGSGLEGPNGGPSGLSWDCSAQALALLPDGLWVGGSFSLAGGKPSSRIARFEGLAQAVPPPGSRVVNAAPSPTTSAFTLRFRIENAGRVLVRMYDITGRQVATIHDAIHSPGPVVIPWDIHLAQGGSLRSGIYLMRIESAGEPERASRVAIIR